MEIHLIEMPANEAIPVVGSILSANCGKILTFTGPIDASWDDGRVCGKCLRIHRVIIQEKLIHSPRTLAFLKFEEGEEDLCVLCLKETGYRKNDPVESRAHYIKYSGQLCKECYMRIHAD